MKKLFAVLLSAALLVSASTGCSAPTESSSQPSGSSSQAESSQGTESTGSSQASGEKISFVWVDNQYDEVQQNNRKEYVLDPFKEAFPNIEIDWRPMSDTTKEIRIQLAAGSGPDLMSLDGPTDTIELFGEGRIIALNDYVEQYNWDDIVYEWALGASSTKDGDITCIPDSWEGMVLYWNNDILEKEGWEVPTTYEELLAISSEVRDRGYIAPMHLGTSGLPRLNEWWETALLGAYAGGDATKQLLTGELKFTDEPIRGTFEKYQEIWSNGVLGNQDTSAITRDDTRALFLQGQLPFYMEGSWFLPLIPEDMNAGVGMLPSFRDNDPSFEPDFSLAIGSVMAINSTASPEKQEAICELINFMFTQEDLHIKAIESGMQPLPRDLDESKFSPDANPKMVEMLSTLNDKMASGKISYSTWTFFPQDTRIYLYEQIDNVFLGNMTMDEFLNGAQELLDKAIAEGTVPALP